MYEGSYLFEMSSFVLASGLFVISAVIAKDTRKVAVEIELMITPLPPSSQGVLRPVYAGPLRERN